MDFFTDPSSGLLYKTNTKEMRWYFNIIKFVVYSLRDPTLHMINIIITTTMTTTTTTTTTTIKL